MLKRQLVIAAFCGWYCIVSAAAGYAQTETTGAIKGSVHEVGQPSSGITNARVKIVNLKTGAETLERSNGAGEYQFNLVMPGQYRILAEADGYLKTDFSEYLLEVPQVKVSVVKPPPLQLSKLGATPAPAPATPLPTPPLDFTPQNPVNLEDATRNAHFNERALLALPLFGNRSFDQLALLAPGVTPAPQALGDTVGPGVGPGVGTSGQFAVNGLRSRANNFTVDGSDNNDEDIGVRRQGFTALVPQSVESVEGFQLTTLLPKSQFGRNLGAQVNAVSRGGSKDFHGTLYGFLTDSRLKARNAFDLTGGPRNFPLTRARDGRPVCVIANLTAPPTAPCAFGAPLAPANPVKGEDPFTRAQYGFVVSGPAAPRDTFLFGSFERRDVNALKESNFAVPTVAERGLFGSGETGLLVNGANEVFPTSVYGDAYFSLFPFPNNPRGPYGPNTYTKLLPASADGSIFSLKLERLFRPPAGVAANSAAAFQREHALTGRYNFTDDATTLPVTGEALFSTLRAQVRTQNLSVFFTSTLAPTLSNEARFSYGRTRLKFAEVRTPYLFDEDGAPLLLPSKKLPNVPFLLNARKFSNATFPTDATTIYQIDGQTEDDTDPVGQVIVSGYSPLGVDVFNFPQRRINNTFQFADTVIWSKLRHHVVFGADLRRTQLDSALDRNFRPIALFQGSLDIASRFGINNRLTPNTRGGFFLGTDFVAAGAATGFFQTQAVETDSSIRLRYWQQDFFITEQFAASPHFKLTLGLRYELNTVPREKNRRIENTFQSPEVQRLIAAEKALPGAGGVSGFELYLAGREGIFNGDRNNLAPHLALAWDPRKDGKTAVRVGYGLYYDQIPGAVISQSRNVFPRFLTLNLAGVTDTGRLNPFNPVRLAAGGTLNLFNPRGPLGPDPVAALLTLSRLPSAAQSNAASTGFVLPQADLVTPYAQHWAVTVEREAHPGLLLSLAYAGTKGTHLLRFTTPNLGPNALPVVSGGVLVGDQIDFQGFVVSPGSDVAQGTNFRRRFPLLGSFTAIESDANSSYHSLQAEASWRLRQAQLTSAYTWSHALDEVSDLFDLAGARALPQNSFNRRGERGSANFDVRHRFAQSFIWDLPYWPTNRLLGGWQLAGIVTLQTGQPFTVLSSIDVNLDGNLTDRPNTLAVSQVNEGSLRYQFPSTLAEQFRLLAPAGRDGAVGRNTLRAPGVALVDLALNKVFKFTERQQLEWRTEVFNLFNRTHFGIPAHVLFAPGLGRSVNTTVPARTVQFAARYRF